METATQNRTVAFAYFGDGKFLGWYSDTFGSLTPNRPKLYNYSKEQVETIVKNFSYKLAKLNEQSNLAETTKVGALSLLDDGLNEDKKSLKDYKLVELRMVDCPHYDGPNPNFDREAWKKLCDERHERLEAFLTKNGVDLESGPSLKRSELVSEFNETDPQPKADRWVYADRTVVNAWAANEPTEFAAVLVAKS